MRKPVSKADQRKNLEAMRPSVQDLKYNLSLYLDETEKILRKLLESQPEPPTTMNRMVSFMVNRFPTRRAHKIQSWLFGLSEKERSKLSRTAFYCRAIRAILANLDRGEIRLAFFQCFPYLISARVFLLSEDKLARQRDLAAIRRRPREPRGIKEAILRMLETKDPPRTALEAWARLSPGWSSRRWGVKVKDRWKGGWYEVTADDFYDHRDPKLLEEREEEEEEDPGPYVRQMKLSKEGRDTGTLVVKLVGLRQFQTHMRQMRKLLQELIRKENENNGLKE